MITKVLVLPDIHAPRHDNTALSPVLEFAKDYEPDILIQIGDLCDYDSLSRFDVLKERDLIGLDVEVRAANEVLDRIEAVLPKKCKKVMLEGNHDRRPETYRLNNWGKDVQKMLGTTGLQYFHEAYNLHKRGWSWVEEGECYKVGKCFFTHGWFVGMHHAKKMVQKRFKTIIYGHTHQSQEHTVVGMDGLPVSGISIGTLSRFDMGYLHGVPPDWCHMFMHIEFFGPGHFTTHPVKVIKGKFYDGKLYGQG